MTGNLNIYQKLIEVRKKVPYLQKAEQGDGMKFKYVSSSQVLSNVREEMDKQGLLLIPKVIGSKVEGDTVEKKDNYGIKHTTTYFTELTIEYTWVNIDNPEEKIVCPWYGQGVDIAGEKGVGKALTYAEKYFLLKFFNIATDKDDPDSFQNKIESDNNKNDKKGNSNGNGWTVTEGMMASIYALGKQKGLSEKSIKNNIMKQFNKTAVTALSQEEYTRLKNGLEKMPDKAQDDNK